MAFPMPDKFKMPRVEKYDGSKDPTKHVENFRANDVACRAFLLTLAEVANDWFTRRPPKSVDNFKDLGYLFLAQLLATRKRKKNPACLMALRQGKDESL
jgi:hypothetical protein